MTTRPHPDPEPLPLRIAPATAEAWPGYLNRTARAYRCEPAHLVAPISSRWASRLRRPHLAACTAGIAMTDDVAAATARRLNLRVEEVQAMQLSVHHGLTVSLDEETTRAFDPVSGSATTTDLRSLGWIADPRRRRWCPRCDPDVDRIAWAYPWAVLCLAHHTLLHPHDADRNGDVSASRWGRLHHTQARLESILAGTRGFSRLSPRDGFVELLAAAEVLASRRQDILLEASTVYEPWVMADVLPAAFTAVETPMDRWPEELDVLVEGKHRGAYLAAVLQKHGSSSPFGLRADLTRFAGEPGHFIRPWAKDIYLPTAHRPITASWSRERARRLLPRSMPEHLTVPTLTDFTPWMSDAHCQVAAAQIAHMLTTGACLKDACDDLGWSQPHQVPLRRLWWHLESTGRFGEYLHAVGQAVHLLLDQPMSSPAPTAEHPPSDGDGSPRPRPAAPRSA
ncbi:TniQ family protein [Janibacter sp. UYMM211]|uniref:TniQ family protein n=1 Tax=Janibacter sp. UYMM211 TaxID=3156342 RepID=UPI00339B554A